MKIRQLLVGFILFPVVTIIGGCAQTQEKASIDVQKTEKTTELVVEQSSSSTITNDTDYIVPDPSEWEKHPVVGIVQPGYYKRVSQIKENETYEEMIEQRDIANKGYLVINEDGTAILDIDGEKTEYFYDKNNFYLSEDSDRVNGIPYIYIGGRIVVDNGTTIIQYLKLTDEEAENLNQYLS